MTFRLAFLAATLVAFTGPAFAQTTTEDTMLDIDYPQSARESALEKHFGESVSDPYRWLEDNHTASSRVAEWIAAQNAITERHLKTLPARDAFRQRIAALVNYESFTIPLKRADRYFFTRRDGTANQAALYVREDVDGADRLLLDPNKWSEDKADALGEWSASDDGRYVAFGVQTGGTDWRTIKVLDVDSGETAEDVVERARFTRIAWAPDGSGFFYSRYPAPLEGTAMDASLANQAVYFHKLGTTQDVDRLVYSTPQDPKLLNVAERVTNGQYLHITTTPGTPESALTVIDLASDAWIPKTVVPDMNSEWSVIGNDGTRLILVTTHGAERRRVVTLDVSEPEPRPVELIPEDANGAIINDAALVGGKFLIAYTIDAKTEFRRFDLDGTEEGPIKLPGIGTAGGFSVDPSENEAFFLFTSYDVPTSIYRYRVADGATLLWEKPEVKVESARIVVEQRFYHSKDGARVPIFITRRADAPEAAPTLLYGYGGFGISLLPEYNPFRLAWVQQGGVLAVANIRGGGEYGRAWHRAGQRENKQNVFDDFIAAAEFLKAERISTPRGLTIQGESGGGLLVGAVTNQRPELFDAVLPGVGVMDMLRYDKFTGGNLWSTEYGSPSEEAAFRNLLSYSPYHNIQAGREYPAILVTTADADDRVVPAHSFKYVAALQAADIGPKPHFIRVETRAGHGSGAPLDKMIARHADMWAFAAYWTGLEVSGSAK